MWSQYAYTRTIDMLCWYLEFYFRYFVYYLTVIRYFFGIWLYQESCGFVFGHGYFLHVSMSCNFWYHNLECKRLLLLLRKIEHCLMSITDNNVNNVTSVSLSIDPAQISPLT